MIDVMEMVCQWTFEFHGIENLHIFSLLVVFILCCALLRYNLFRYTDYLDKFKDDKDIYQQLKLLNGQRDQIALDKYDEQKIRKIKVFRSM